jgi:hypothetical protein
VLLAFLGRVFDSLAFVDGFDLPSFMDVGKARIDIPPNGWRTRFQFAMPPPQHGSPALSRMPKSGRRSSKWITADFSGGSVTIAGFASLMDETYSVGSSKLLGSAVLLSR